LVECRVIARIGLLKAEVIKIEKVVFGEYYYLDYSALLLRNLIIFISGTAGYTARFRFDCYSDLYHVKNKCQNGEWASRGQLYKVKRKSWYQAIVKSDNSSNSFYSCAVHFDKHISKYDGYIHFCNNQILGPRLNLSIVQAIGTPG
jgi:hypothetical protein